MIRKATGCDAGDVDEVESLMRDVVFHSTLDWQSREQFDDGARQAYDVLKAQRAPTYPDRFEPAPRRRPLRGGEIEVRKGTGHKAKWFYVENDRHAITLVRLGRDHGFPTEITRRQQVVGQTTSVRFEWHAETGFTNGGEISGEGWYFRTPDMEAAGEGWEGPHDNIIEAAAAADTACCLAEWKETTDNGRQH